LEDVGGDGRIIQKMNIEETGLGAWTGAIGLMIRASGGIL
jgi:hypothetical protein